MEVMLVTEGGEERVVEYQTGVWTHPCGSQLCFLCEDGTIECSRCGKCIIGLSWVDRLVS